MTLSYYADRVNLVHVLRRFPHWTVPQLAHALQRSESWVKKWRKRLVPLLERPAALRASRYSDTHVPPNILQLGWTPKSKRPSYTSVISLPRGSEEHQDREPSNSISNEMQPCKRSTLPSPAQPGRFIRSWSDTNASFRASQRPGSQWNVLNR
jgi:hypothetical protein